MRTTALASAAWLPLLVSALAVQAQTVAPAANSAQPLALVQGQQQLFKPGIAIARIAIGDPAVLDVQVLGELPQTGKPATGKAAGQRPVRHAELLLTPKAAGSTTFMVWPSQGEPQTWNVVVSGPRLLLERRLQSLPEHARASADLALTAPKGTPLTDLSQVNVRSNTVQVDVQVVEFKKSAMRRAGVQLNSGGANDHGFQFGVYTPGSNGSSSGSSSGSSGSGSGTGSGTDGGTSAIASAMNLVLGFGRAFSGKGITAQLGFLEGNGLARVLAKPTLVAQSGQTASFLAGGEIPIPVPSGGSNSISIQYKEFGVKLQLTPTILSNERIALKVAPEASDLDYTQGVTINDISVPALRTRRADTFVELADSESFVIGGLVSRSTLSNVNKVPLLGDLPILGTFFKNLNYSQEETELVIIVTPRLVQPLPAGTNLEALLPGAQQELPNAGRVWAPYAVGAPYADSPLPGFSY
ncbi:pilus assembly protein N-terminal domain-containing protein [Comamonas sp. JUb58]|uniref:type II and III secretion system protein family protein n=1 Tax=Comamonas sp. JUb58 TaxID=2485114 RepID=UPI00105E2771|nr:pilus assembly protein N-terminal domain-containing protein [Comamonas sp. JUb58]TDS73177.1 pilus assembly protein CpaC [Comamonas sp. JUb58]